MAGGDRSSWGRNIVNNSVWTTHLPYLWSRTAFRPAPRTAEMPPRAERLAAMRRLPFREQQVVNLQLLIASAAAAAILVGAAALLAGPLAFRRLSLLIGT